MSVAEGLRSWAQTISSPVWYNSFPECVVDRASEVVLDLLVAMVAGAQSGEVVALSRFAERFSYGNTWTVTGSSLAPPFSAMVNGSAATVWEITEGNRFANGHPGVHVVPVALAAAESFGASGVELLRAVITGYETAVRISRAGQLPAVRHPHGTWGSAAAAVAVQMLRGANAEDIMRALGVAASYSLTTGYRTAFIGATVRNTYSGLSALLGYLAAEVEVTGDLDEGYYGVFDSIDGNAILRQPPAGYYILHNYFKPYPGVRHMHGAVYLALQWLAEGGRVDEIRRILVELPSWPARFNNPRPSNQLAALFSIPYGIAVTLLRRVIDPASFAAPWIDDPRVHSIIDKIELKGTEEFDRFWPDARPTRVRIDTSQAHWEGYVPLPPGEGTLAMGEERRERYRMVLAEYFGMSGAEAVMTEIRELRYRSSLSKLWNLLHRTDG